MECDNCLRVITCDELAFTIRDRKTKLEMMICADCIGISSKMQAFIKRKFPEWEKRGEKMSIEKGDPIVSKLLKLKEIEYDLTPIYSENHRAIEPEQLNAVYECMDRAIEELRKMINILRDHGIDPKVLSQLKQY